MRKNRLPSSAGLTLVELLVVLAIMASIATVAAVSLDGTVEGSRSQATQSTLSDLQQAILGPANLRNSDGTPIISGFIADVGRLPKTYLPPGQTAGEEVVTLDELWNSSLWSSTAVYGIKPADAATLADPLDADPAVAVPCGWRGPYLRLPIGNRDLFDGWGHRLASPLVASADEADASYHHLRTLTGDVAITAVDVEVSLIRSLGADGTFTNGPGLYDANLEVSVAATDYQAAISGVVSVRNDMGVLVTPKSGDSVIVKVFGPDPVSVGRIKVFKTPAPIVFNGSADTVSYSIPLSDGMTHGPKVIRAYFTDSMPTPPITLMTKSVAATITLRPGANVRDLVIDRN